MVYTVSFVGQGMRILLSIIVFIIVIVGRKAEPKLIKPTSSDQLNRHNVLEHDASLRYAFHSY